MDVVCEDKEFLNGHAHAGFVDGARMVLGKCAAVLERALCDHFGYALVVCGHSMGGSVAIALALQLQRGGAAVVVPPGVAVRCVALGPAPVYRGSLPSSPPSCVRIYINNRDVVPRLRWSSMTHDSAQCLVIAKILKIKPSVSYDLYSQVS